MNIKLIGDVHGYVYPYLAKIKDAEASIQVGDFGMGKDWFELEKQNIDSTKHKIIPGNHDDYYGLREQYTFGKDFGDVSFHGLDLFFVRGAWSIDYQMRIAGVSWWNQEEIEVERLEQAIELYVDLKPDVMFSHDAPGDWVDGVSTIMFGSLWHPNRTSSALHRMFQFHQPKMWFFGHWHKTMSGMIKNTLFTCIDELDVLNYNTEKSLNWNIDDIQRQVKKIRYEKSKESKLW